MSIDATLLSRISTNDPSLNTLNLASQNLNIDDIKKLVDALKENSYLTTLDLTGNQINDEGALLLAQPLHFTSLNLSANLIRKTGVLALAQSMNIRELDISYNDIGNVGALALAQNTVLISLNAAGNQINHEGVQGFADNVTLSHLNLSENQISDEGARILAKNKRLTSLVLIRNQIADKGVIALAQHPTLTSLILCYNDIREKGGEALARNSMLTHLDISYNRIGASAAYAFISNTTLQSLAIAGNQINNWGTDALAKNKTITSMDLSYNQIDDEGAKYIFANPYITRLNLSYNQLSTKSAKAVVDHPNLTYLSISYNLLGDEGAALLAQSKGLTWLDLTENLVGFLGAEALAKNRYLKTLILSHNLLDDEGAEAIAKNTTLDELFLSYNQITDRGAIALAQNQTLSRLNVNYNHIESEGRQALTQNKTLKLLEISDEQPPEFTTENITTSFLLSQDFICIRSKSGTIQFFNPSFARVLGYCADELLAKPYHAFLHPADYPAEEALLTATNQKFPIYYHENRYRCKDGSYRSIRWSSQIRRNRVYAVGTDITLQKQVEKELRSKEREMEIDAVKAEAAAVYTKEQANFIAHLCHEIRNPLSGVYGNIEIAQEQLSAIQALMSSLSQVIEPTVYQQLNERLTQMQECHAAVETCTEYQKAILDDNLDMAKIAERKFILDTKPFDLKMALQDVVKMFKAKAAQKNLMINLNLPEEEVIVKGDIARIKQIVINLLSNAIKFTEKGSINISASIQKQTEVDTWFEIKVADTGIGLKEEEISHLFKRFTQASATVGSQYGGSGLGLLIAKSLAQLMGGDIIVTSQKGQGSTFSCTIRCKNLQAEEKKSMAEEALLAHKLAVNLQFSPIKASVLIVDDNDINRKVLTHHIKKAGYACLFAVNGQEAIDSYQNNPIDIILMDIIMPRMNGLEAAQFIRQYEREKNRSRVPIIALTGNALEDDKNKAMEAGMDDYITKPFKADEILQKLARLLKPNPEHESKKQKLSMSHSLA